MISMGLEIRSRLKRPAAQAAASANVMAMVDAAEAASMSALATSVSCLAPL